MLKLEALAEHLAAQGATSRFAYNKTPLRPHRTTTITELPGGTSEMEDALDSPYLQIRCQSDLNEPQQARDDAHEFDRIFLHPQTWPADLGGYRVVSAGRLGGPPAFLHTDDEGRTTYVCNYFLKQQR